MPKKPNLKALRTKTDKLLTPWICGKHKRCLLCPNASQVAHHFIYKSQSSRLRYEEINLIPLCTICHCKLHHDENIGASKIVAVKGAKWFREIETIKRELVKTDRYFYMENYERIQQELCKS